MKSSWGEAGSMQRGSSLVGEGNLQLHSLIQGRRAGSCKGRVGIEAVQRRSKWLGEYKSLTVGLRVPGLESGVEGRPGFPC